MKPGFLQPETASFAGDAAFSKDAASKRQSQRYVARQYHFSASGSPLFRGGPRQLTFALRLPPSEFLLLSAENFYTLIF